MNLEQRVSKLEGKYLAKVVSDIVIIILFVILIIYLIVIGIRSFYPKEQQSIIFNITGIINSTNATTLTQLHLECIKYCGDYIVHQTLLILVLNNALI